jgi:hypothetical protein
MLERHGQKANFGAVKICLFAQKNTQKSMMSGGISLLKIYRFVL